ARLAMATDPKSVLANQLFKELERVHPPDIAISPITARAQLTKSNLARRIIDLGKGNVIVVGDLLIDELLEGRPERISREAPVLILEHVDTNLIPGGAANTANNITALGGACHAIGVCGVDDYAGKLAAMLEKHGITHDLVADPTRPTTVKTRILSKSHSLMQQLLRLDRIAHRNIDSSVERELGLKVAAAASRYQAIILSDYRAGAITNSIIESCRKIAMETRTLLIVDAQNGFERFGGCSLITPNQPDTEAALGYKIDSPLNLSRAGDEMLRLSGAEAILITRGSEGMALFQKNQPMEELPPFNRSEVFDVTGAGDTVVATMALALVTGSSYVEAMALGNLAAGIVVKKSGTAVTSQKEMLDTLETLDI
ncbi:MAG: bifunctional hydroxymethylpyrimidine kinase/phosphomethylpyrimidine kinase, partial [Cyanobacteria bacterium HKST-UBA02]|nr:bifunctional hydroxymethylpyrimidine kinase/phosphomethylpyrimidine kinase [Cyanobacteria bacterium HKST-UBA02]